MLRPPVAQERVDLRPDGLVRITVKKAFADGTVAVDIDPLSLLCRLATSVPPPWFRTVRYAGVLASASPWRSRIAPEPPPETGEPETPRRAGGYRPWAELLARTFRGGCPRLSQVRGAHELLAMVTDPASIARYLAAVGEGTKCRAARRAAASRTGTAASFAGRRPGTRTGAGATAPGTTRRRRGGARAGGPWRGALCALRGIGATERSPGPEQRRAGARSGWRNAAGGPSATSARTGVDGRIGLV